MRIQNSCCKEGRYSCYFCNSRVCKEHSSAYIKFRSWRTKIKPKICQSCINQMALHKWLDKEQIKQVNIRKFMERYNNDPQYRQKAIDSMKRYVKNNREKVSSYHKNKMKTDPVYRRKVLDIQNKAQRKRYANDPVWRAKRREWDRLRYLKRKSLNTH